VSFRDGRLASRSANSMTARGRISVRKFASVTSCATERVIQPAVELHPHIAERRRGLRNKFRAAALDEVAGFGDDILQYFDELPDARLAIDDFSG
jgi:hypothetical protein